MARTELEELYSAASFDLANADLADGNNKLPYTRNRRGKRPLNEQGSLP